MISYNIRIEGLEKINEGLKRAPSEVVKEVSQAVEKSLVTIHNEVIKQAPVNKSTGGGNLRQNLRQRMLTKLSGVVESMAPYGGFVEEGTKPHVIMPRKVSVLATESRRAPAWPVISNKGFAIFGRKVMHPGTKANPYMKRSVDNTKQKVEQFFTEAMEKIAKSITNG